MRRAAWIVGVVLAGAIPGVGSAAPVARQPIDVSEKISARAAARQEAALGLPRHLLNAIGKAESGRWNEATRESFAWPWTVTAGGEGRHFDTKAEALAEVRRLQARKVTNIDVGCMQVNLGWHGHNFASIEEAIDPAANTAFAGRFLKTLRETSADWMEAAGRYHSSDAQRNGPYRAKVATLWDETKRDEAKRPEAYAALAAPEPVAPDRALAVNARHPTAAPVKTLRPAVAPIDYECTAQINANFRAAREKITDQASGIVNAADAAANRARLAPARFGPVIAREVRTNAPTQVAARERIFARDHINGGGDSPAADRFAAKRASDLARWRTSRSGGEF
jgi:hypothetical protein